MNKYNFMSICLAILLFISCSKMDTKSFHGKELNSLYGGSSDDGIYSVLATKDGGYLFAGWTNSNDGDVKYNHGQGDVWIGKINSKGNLQWQKTFGGSGSEAAMQIIPASDGGFVFVGHTYSSNGDVPTGNGYISGWIVKLDINGKIGWQKLIGEFATSITAMPDGGYVALIGSPDGHNGNGHIMALKFDQNGNQLWKSEFSPGEFDIPTRIITCTDGGVLLVATTATNGADGGWIIKLDKSGNKIWEKGYAGTSTDYICSVINSSDGGYIVAGFTKSNDGDFSSNHGGTDAWIFKIDDSGSVQWQKLVGGSGDDQIRSIVQAADGGYILAGSTESNNGDVSGNHSGEDAWVFKLDAKGNVAWQRCMGGSENFESFFGALEIPGQGYLLNGASNSNNGDVSGNHGADDGWVVLLPNH